MSSAIPLIYFNSIAEITESEVLEMAPLSHDFVKAVGELVNITNNPKTADTYGY